MTSTVLCGIFAQSTGVNVEHAVHVKAICHSLLSFIGFETGSDVDDKSRSAYYDLPNFPDLEFGLRVEDIPRTESDAPNMMVTLQWRQQNTDWQLSVSVVFLQVQFFADVRLRAPGRFASKFSSASMWRSLQILTR